MKSWAVNNFSAADGHPEIHNLVEINLDWFSQVYSLYTAISIRCISFLIVRTTGRFCPKIEGNGRAEQ